MLFDTWGGALSTPAYYEFSLRLHGADRAATWSASARAAASR